MALPEPLCSFPVYRASAVNEHRTVSFSAHTERKASGPCGDSWSRSCVIMDSSRVFVLFGHWTISRSAQWKDEWTQWIMSSSKSEGCYLLKGQSGHECLKYCNSRTWDIILLGKGDNLKNRSEEEVVCIFMFFINCNIFSERVSSFQNDTRKPCRLVGHATTVLSHDNL